MEIIKNCESCGRELVDDEIEVGTCVGCTEEDRDVDR